VVGRSMTIRRAAAGRCTRCGVVAAGRTCPRCLEQYAQRRAHEREALAADPIAHERLRQQKRVEAKRRRARRKLEAAQALLLARAVQRAT
jgi:hypothetical protein